MMASKGDDKPGGMGYKRGAKPVAKPVKKTTKPASKKR
jgi:hypothetical protein